MSDNEPEDNMVDASKLTPLEATRAYADFLEEEIAEYETELAKYRWIKCSERLPENDSDVIIANADSIAFGYYGPNAHCEKEWFYSDFAEAFHVTHWMPLPEPPKEEK